MKHFGLMVLLTHNVYKTKQNKTKQIKTNQVKLLH